MKHLCLCRVLSVFLISGPSKRRKQGIRIAQDGDAADARDARAADRDIRVLRRLVAHQGRRVNALLKG
jgi:uncharacterized protein YciI